MVMAGDSCSKGRGFKSQHHILDGHFFTFICCKIVMLFEKTEINEKEAGMANLIKHFSAYFTNGSPVSDFEIRSRFSVTEILPEPELSKSAENKTAIASSPTSSSFSYKK